MFSRRFSKFGISGIDVHKPYKPVIAEMGGLAILSGVALASVPLLLFGNLDSGLALTAFATIALVGLLGVADDISGLKQRYKPFLVAFTSLPLVVSLAGRTDLSLPLLGFISLGALYPFFVVPLAVTTSANFSNMLAGFNGLEAGYSAIAIGALSFLCWSKGEVALALFGTLLVVAYLGFLKLNWYPARIFPGDSGTLMGGAAIAALGLAGRLEFAAIVVSIPAAFDFALKMLSRRPFAQRHDFSDSMINSDGTLEPAGYPALVHAFMKVSPLGEEELVRSLLLMELCYAALAVAATLFLM